MTNKGKLGTNLLVSSNSGKLVSCSCNTLAILARSFGPLLAIGQAWSQEGS